MPCILLFETEYSLEFVYTNLPFLSRPSDTKIQTAITWCLQQQKSQKFENVRLWTSIFRNENLKIVSLITSELFNRNLSIVHPTLFFNSVIAPKMWETIEKLIKMSFGSNPVYGDDVQYIKTKIKKYAGSIITNFCNKKMPKEKASC